MTVTQSNILYTLKQGYNTTKQVADLNGISESRAIDELRNLELLGLVETNMVKTMWFSK